METCHDDLCEKFSLIDIGSFVAINVSGISVKLFHIIKIVTAVDNMADSANDHFLLKRKQYVVGKWCSFQNEGKKFAYYKKEATNFKDALIDVAEVFSTNVGLTKELQLDITEYRMLCCNV